MKFRGFDNLLLTKDFRKYKVLGTKKIRTVNQNLVHKSLKNITFFKHDAFNQNKAHIN